MYVGLKGAIMLTIIAMTIVFAVLGLLALMMVALRKIVGFASSKKDKETKVLISEKKEIKDTAKTALVPDRTSQDKEDENLIAVISAAVTSYLQSMNSLQPIRVLSIRRVMPLSLTPWAIVGKQNQMSERILINTRKKGEF